MKHNKINRSLYISILLAITVIGQSCSNQGNKKEVEPQVLTYLDYSKDYADAMIEAGRDTYGEVHSSLFASTLDRKTMKIGEQPGVPGVRSNDRNLYGANLQEDLGLYELLYDLTEVTGNKQYAREADKAFEFFFKNTQSPVTGLYPWGEHLSWNFETDKADGYKMLHEMNYLWPYWDKAPVENFWKFTFGLLDHGIITRDDGSITFSRHAQYDRHNPWQDSQFPRYGGLFILTFMEAYGRPDSKDQPRREELLKMAERVMATYEEKLKNCGYIPDAGDAMGTKNGTRMDSWPDQSIELARCIWEGAEHAPEPLKGRMKEFSLAVEKTFFENNRRNPIEHKVLSGGGFHVRVKHPRKPGEKPESASSTWTTDWSVGYGTAQTHATTIMTRLLPRYEQVKKEHPEIAARYVEMFHAVAETYMTSEPNLKKPLTPGAFSAVIEFLITMHTMTGESKYLERADHFARLGVGLFIDGDSPLPKASSENDHYETKTNGPDFMHTLLIHHRKGL